LADAYAASPINGDARPLEVWPRARYAAAHAVDADPELAEAQTSLGIVNFFLDWDWAGAETAFRKAIELDPNYCLAHRTLGIALSHMRRDEEARLAAHASSNRSTRRIMRSPPKSPSTPAITPQRCSSPGKPSSSIRNF